MGKINNNIAKGFHSEKLLLSGILVTAALLVYIIVLFTSEKDQSWLTPLLVLLSISFACIWCIPAAKNKLDNRVDWFHPSILFLLVYLAYFIFPGIWLWLANDYTPNWIFLGKDPAYNINSVFFLGIISVAAFGVGVRAKFALPSKFIQSHSNLFQRQEVYGVIIVFFVIGSGFKIYHLSLITPLVSDIFSSLSPTMRRDLQINISFSYLILESMLNWSILLAIFYYIANYSKTGIKKGGIIIFLLFSIVILLDYIVSAKRSEIIMLIILPVIWWHYIITPLNIRVAATYFILCVASIGALLILRISLPLISQDIDSVDVIGSNLSEILDFYFNTPEWSTFEMITASFVQREALLEQAGGSIWGFIKYTFGTLFVFIPRFIWADKPGYDDLSHVYFQFVTGIDETVGFAPTLWGASFLFFHIGGLIFGMCLFGIICKGVYTMLSPWKGKPISIFYYSIFFWITFQFIRFGTMGFTLLYFIKAILIGVIAALFLSLRKRIKTSQHIP